MRPLNPAEPVCHLSYYEADAYADLGRQAAADRGGVGAGGGWTAPSPATSSMTAGCIRARPGAGRACKQLFGDVWEWTGSAYLAYPGYRAAPGASGEYNGKFMCNQMVLRGGSCATSRDHVRATYRNFFYPQRTLAVQRIPTRGDDHHETRGSRQRPSSGSRSTTTGRAESAEAARDPLLRLPSRPPRTCAPRSWRGWSGHVKRLPPKLFYDQRGSQLFDAITRLPGVLPDPHRDRHPARSRRRDGRSARARERADRAGQRQQSQDPDPARRAAARASMSPSTSPRSICWSPPRRSRCASRRCRFAPPAPTIPAPSSCRWSRTGPTWRPSSPDPASATSIRMTPEASWNGSRTGARVLADGS